MKIKRTVLTGLVAVLAITALLHARKKTAQPQPTQSGTVIEQKPAQYPFTFVAYGDTRFMDPADHKNSDPERRMALVHQITAEKPNFIVINGDIVHDGSNAKDWEEYDKETQAWKAASITVFPALGNHDVKGEGDPLTNYFARYPIIGGQRWYAVHYGNCLLLALDSNSDEAPASPQGQWLAARLQNVPADVQFIIFSMHHPPYTKSSDHMMGGGHTARSQEQELGALLEERQKTLKARIVVFAGHVHNYERYEHNGVMYIVSGGGGAPPYLFDRSPNDFYHESGPTYHYCKVTVDHGRLQFEMHKLEMNGGSASWRVADRFELTSAQVRQAVPDLRMATADFSQSPAERSLASS